jgi:hypothetical protein
MDPATVDYYQHHAHEWAAARPDVHSPGLDWFLDHSRPARAFSSLVAATAATPR